MDQKIKSTLGKTIKIAGVTCIALGGAALIASGAALKAIAGGGRYLKEAVQRILHEEPQADTTPEEAPEQAPKALAAAEPEAEQPADAAGTESPETC